MVEQGVAASDDRAGGALVRAAPPGEATRSSEADRPRFDVFLSHNSRDKPIVERLAERLKRDGLEPWLDKWCLTPGGTWQDELDAGVRGSSACAIFVGPHGLGDWSREELYVARDRAVKERGGYRLFLVLLPGYPELFDQNALPPFLSSRTWVDLRQGIDDPRGFRSFLHAIRGIPLGPEAPIEPRQDVCPYQGLQSFDEQHAEFFFGRDGDVQRLLEKLKAARFLAVLGPSGSGKSSLVRAGLLPALRKAGLPGSDHWEICVLTPGARPVERLALELARRIGGDDPLGTARTVEGHLRDDESALDRAARLTLAARPAPPGQEQGRQLLVVVDQFEEVFTLCRDEAERAQLLANLLYATSVPDGSTTVVLTMRADFYHRCAAHPALAARVAAQQFLVSPMSQDGLRQAIEEPARRVGLELESGLVETILTDVADQPGSLPLLEHALLELWERRWGTMLTLAAYRERGGVRGAIAKRADAIYGGFSPEEQAVAERALLRLTQLGEGTADTRRRAALSELATIADDPSLVERVVRRLAGADARLLTTSRDPETGDDWVDISHEALIRSWPQLRDWIDKGRADLQVHRRVTEAAQDWQRLDRDDGPLYRGARLAEALEWRERNDAALNRLERDFLEASDALKEWAERAEQERRRRELDDARRLAETESRRAEAATALVRSEKKARGRLRAFVTGITALLVLALLTAGLAVQQRAEADTQRLEADTQRLEAESQRREAEGQRTEAESQRGEAEAQRAAAEGQQRVARSRELAASSTSLLPTDPELSVLLATEAARAAPTDQAEDALRQALRRWYARGHPADHAGPVYGAQFSEDGARMVTASRDGTARVWDVATGRTVAELRHGSSVTSAQFSSDGKRVVTAGEDGAARVWEAATGRTVAELRGHTGPLFRAQFNPDGGRVVTAGRDGTARLWRADTGRELAELRHEGPVQRATFSPDGGRVVTASEDGTARVWDAGTGTRLAELRGHTHWVLRAQFSPDGTRVITASRDRTTRVWDAASGDRLAELRHDDAVVGVQFSPDGGRVATASLDGKARIWEPAGDRVTELKHAGAVLGAQFDRAGRSVVTASLDGTARVWEAGTGRAVAELRGHRGQVWSALFSADDKRVATAGEDGTARVWQVDAGAAQVEVRHVGPVVGVDFSRDGARLATAGEDGRARIWEAGTGRRVADLPHGSSVASAQFSSDGTRLVTAANDGAARIWDWGSGAVLIELRGHAGPVNRARFSPDGRRVVTAGEDRTARVWEADGGCLLAELRHGQAVQDAQFSADGARVVTAGEDGTARIWDWGTEAALTELRGHAGRVLSARFSPDGTRVVTAGDDRMARVWDAATGGALLDLRGHAGIVWAAQFGPDGGRIVTASADRTTRVWEAGTGRGVAELQTQDPALVLDAQFSPDGARVATAAEDGAARIFACDACGALGELIALARDRVTRELTAEERERYFHEPRRS